MLEYPVSFLSSPLSLSTGWRTDTSKMESLTLQVPPQVSSASEHTVHGVCSP